MSEGDMANGEAPKEEVQEEQNNGNNENNETTNNQNEGETNEKTDNEKNEEAEKHKDEKRKARENIPSPSALITGRAIAYQYSIDFTPASRFVIPKFNEEVTLIRPYVAKFSPHEFLFLAIAGEEGEISFVRGQEALQQQKPIYSVDSFSVVDNSIFDLVFLNNSNIIVVGTGEQSVIFIDVQKCVPIKSYIKHLGTVLCLSNLGDNVLSGGRDGSVYLWDYRQKDPISYIQLKSQPSILSIASASPTYFFTSDSHGELLCWDSRNLKKPFPISIPEQNARVPISSLSISPNHKILASISTNSYITFYSLDNDFCYVTQHWPNVGSFYIRCCFSPCSRYLLTGSSSGALNVFKVGQNETPQVFICHTSAATCVEWNKESFDTIVSCSDDKTTQLWTSEYKAVEGEYEMEFVPVINVKSEEKSKKKKNLRSTTLFDFM
ncbi:denticleless protein [Histomonas meleagridis]|uniref:denticleless protein-like n=1 Tax=Histomonas meleagridis TaxID=135588 RepID=UPI00355A7B34|nr:denticleless protein [Histomonas meleagridis]KAH0803181.1 denticleless protein-like [Histomonas meleagridis]